ncbi:MAG: nucleotidyltransferase family protein [Simkaniaceae bacterium]|nr:nucleotidyltransferase family protein [Simkaniaceae bacterium]
MKTLPTPEQLLLLQASLFLDDRALCAWKTWVQQVDFDQIDPASYKLLPLVARNPILANLQDPIFEKCKGIYRQVWVTNQLNWKKMLPILQHLPRVNKMILLKGMAMILHYYKDFGVRVLGDIDIFIERSEIQPVVAFLHASGWQSKMPCRFDINKEEHLNRWHALNFTHANGLHLDLHWSFIEENALPLDQAVLADSELLFSNLYLPNATDLLFQICIHGMKPSPIPLIRWMADAVTLLRHAEIDWPRLVNLAKQVHVCRSLSLALQFLLEQFDAPIPPSPLHELKQATVPYLEYLVCWSYKRNHHQLAAWCRFCLRNDYLTLSQQIIHIPRYLQSTARLKSRWQVPFFVLYWPLKQLLKRLKINATALI